MTSVHDEEADEPPPPEEHIAPAPRISVQAFCETEQPLAAMPAAGEDRRLGKAHLSVKMGGMAAAIETYHTLPTPNVIVLETDGTRDILTASTISPPFAIPAPASS